MVRFGRIKNLNRPRAKGPQPRRWRGNRGNDVEESADLSVVEIVEEVIEVDVEDEPQYGECIVDGVKYVYRELPLSLTRQGLSAEACLRRMAPAQMRVCDVWAIVPSKTDEVLQGVRIEINVLLDEPEEIIEADIQRWEREEFIPEYSEAELDDMRIELLTLLLRAQWLGRSARKRKKRLQSRYYNALRDRSRRIERPRDTESWIAMLEEHQEAA